MTQARERERESDAHVRHLRTEMTISEGAGGNSGVPGGSESGEDWQATRQLARPNVALSLAAGASASFSLALGGLMLFMSG